MNQSFVRAIVESKSLLLVLLLTAFLLLSLRCYLGFFECLFFFLFLLIILFLIVILLQVRVIPCFLWFLYLSIWIDSLLPQVCFSLFLTHNLSVGHFLCDLSRLTNVFLLGVFRISGLCSGPICFTLISSCHFNKL